MFGDVAKYVRECTDYQESKHRRTRVVGESMPLLPPKQQWSEVSLDFITKLPLTTNELYDATRVATDSMSKRVHLYPVLEKGLTERALQFPTSMKYSSYMGCRQQSVVTVIHVLHQLFGLHFGSYVELSCR